MSCERQSLYSNMKILHVVPALHKSGGGPSESVPMTAMAQLRSGLNVGIAFYECGEMSEKAKEAERVGVKLIRFRGSRTRFNPVAFSWDLVRRFEDVAKDYDVIHTHVQWMFPIWWAAHVAKKLNKPLVMMPRGSFAPERLRESAWKKKLVGWLDRRAAHDASAVWATSESEAEGIRAYVPGAKVEVFPIGLDVERYQVERKGGGGQRTILFFSRISPIKGLDLLAEAWGRITGDCRVWPDLDEYGNARANLGEVTVIVQHAREKQTPPPKFRPLTEVVETVAKHQAAGFSPSTTPNTISHSLCLCKGEWKLLIVGPDDRGYTEEIKKVFAVKCPAGSYEFRGPVYGDEKFKLLTSADAFVLPTRNENWGIAVAEAMASGLPVICTKGAPWSCLETEKAGWWTDVSVEGLERALRELMSLDDGELRSRGQLARRWVEANLDWSVIARRMRTSYERIVRHG